MNTSQIYQLCLLFVGLHLLAVPAFVWAMRRRQLTMQDKTVYAIVDDTPEAALPDAAPFPKWRLRLMLSVLATMFALILWSTFAVMTASFAGPPAPGSVTQKAVCPFGFK